ncbi:MAG: hypothetical protein FJ241_12905, partial [Nitrospira sp.]|nr:hypothetical protein [Nitrospira sp.]
MKKVLSSLICLLSFMVVFTACSGGGSKTNTTNNSGTGGGNTQINNTQQGAQTSITTRNIADDVIGSFGLTNLVGTGNVKESLKHAYDLRKYIIKIRPMFNRAKLFSAAETPPCDNQGGTMTFDDLGDNNDMTGKTTFQNCRLTIDIDEDGIDDYLELNGAVETTCSDDNCDSITVTFGENGQQY